MKEFRKKHDDSKHTHQTQVDELKDSIDALTDKLKRSHADFLNLQRRTAEEKEDFAQYAGATILEKIIPIYDQLENSLKHLSEDQKNDGWVKGVICLVDLFKKTLTDLGVEKIETHNAKYHPEYHEAVMTGEGNEKDIILEEYESGYTYKGKVLRPAKVKVCVLKE